MADLLAPIYLVDLVDLVNPVAPIDLEGWAMIMHARQVWKLLYICLQILMSC